MLNVTFKLVEEYSAQSIPSLHPPAVLGHLRQLAIATPSSKRKEPLVVDLTMNGFSSAHHGISSVGSGELLIDKIRYYARQIDRDIVLNITFEVTIWDIWCKFTYIHARYDTDRFGSGEHHRWAGNTALETLIRNWAQGTWVALKSLNIVAGNVTHRLLPHNVQHSKARVHAIGQLHLFQTMPWSLFDTPHQFAKALGLEMRYNTPLSKLAHCQCAYTFTDGATRGRWKVAVPISKEPVSDKPLDVRWGQRYKGVNYPTPEYYSGEEDES